MKAGRTDIVVAGAGYVGLALALAIRHEAPGIGVTVVDPAPEGAAARDERASAVAAAGRRMLERLGVWPELEGEAQKISDMIVTDSRSNDIARPVFLTFSGAVEDGEPFAHMVPNAALVGALRRRATAAGAVLMAGETVDDFTDVDGGVRVVLGGGDTIDARLLVAADGIRSRLRGLAGIGTTGWRYDQSGIVATVAHERPHHGRAEEHFLPAGPFAVLPLTGNRSSLVWTERTRLAERLVTASDTVFRLELERRFGHHLGRLKPVGRRQAFPLGLTLARQFVKPRFALIGDAAHGIHPIAGQGLNLGFKDAAALAETVVDAARLGLDIGTLPVLERYQRWRRADTVQMGIVTDALNRLFSNDLAPVRLVRDFGLGLVDRMPGLKARFIRQAAGVGADQPRLLRGEGI